MLLNGNLEFRTARWGIQTPAAVGLPVAAIGTGLRRAKPFKHLGSRTKDRHVSDHEHTRYVKASHSGQRDSRDDWAKVLAAMEVRQHQREAR